ncbi:hypothetical protein OS493_012275 [Desmophyllum pertusum]|uniref:Uncharacterized protein n=1 Tax=Desmophyllum pertusum TaxID=174260 RepID=A0A9X0D478_9CNID|nr:hypothetical protein OS493_012275 [Desmophyllum pertusum]
MVSWLPSQSLTYIPDLRMSEFISECRQIFKFTQLACKNIESNKHVKRSEWKITATKTGLKFGTVNPEAVFTNQEMTRSGF